MQILADAQLALGSKADNFWSKLAIERGSCPQAVVGKFAQVSERAQAKIRRGNTRIWRDRQFFPEKGAP